jgi:hypothetical protein
VRQVPLLLAVACGCGSSTANVAAPQPEDPWRGARAPVVFQGLVLERLPSPEVWCGIVATFQGVRYRVDSVASGPMEPGERVVYHALVGPPLCERDEPVLSREIFRVGQRLRVSCERTEAGEFVGWEQPGSVEVLR